MIVTSRKQVSADTRSPCWCFAISVPSPALFRLIQPVGQCDLSWVGAAFRRSCEVFEDGARLGVCAGPTCCSMSRSISVMIALAAAIESLSPRGVVWTRLGAVVVRVGQAPEVATLLEVVDQLQQAVRCAAQPCLAVM